MTSPDLDPATSPARDPATSPPADSLAWTGRNVLGLAALGFALAGVGVVAVVFARRRRDLPMG